MRVIKYMLSFRNILPALWGIGVFNILRMVTDLAKKEEFWAGGFQIHSIGMAISIGFCYAVSFLWRKQLLKRCDVSGKVNVQLFREYGYVLVQLIILLNGVILVAENRGWVYMGDGFIDYLLVNATYVPLFLFYYTLLRIEVINKNLVDNRLYVEQLKADKLDSELQLLKNQYHPHFLFNALNTIYFQIDEENKLAKRSVEQLSELLRYQIYNADVQVSLQEEINFLQSYIAFQQQRLTERLKLTTAVDSDWQGLTIYPLIFLPLLENAFKYVRGAYEIEVILKKEVNRIYFKVVNTIAAEQHLSQGAHLGQRNTGAGLLNLRKRLELLYPNKYNLNTRKEHSRFIAELTIDV